MGLTPFDVSNLNSAISGLGNTFAERRQEALRAQQLGIEQDIRQKMLEAELRRVSAEEGRQNLLSQGNVDVWLQKQSGGLVRYQGAPPGLQKLFDQGEAEGDPFSEVDPPTKPPVGTVRMQLGDWGIAEAPFSSPDELASIQQKWAATAKAPQPGQAGQSSAIQNMGAYQQSLDREAALRQAGNTDAADAEAAKRDRFFPSEARPTITPGQRAALQNWQSELSHLTRDPVTAMQNADRVQQLHGLINGVLSQDPSVASVMGPAAGGAGPNLNAAFQSWQRTNNPSKAGAAVTNGVANGAPLDLNLAPVTPPPSEGF